MPATTQSVLQDILTHIERLEKKLDLLIEELPEEEIEEIKKEVRELVEKTRRGDFTGLISVDDL